VLRREIDGMRAQMESGLTDEAIDEMAEQVKDRPETVFESVAEQLVCRDSSARAPVCAPAS